ncbi:hypothetical protein GCM10009092_08560 [Bowmanella denitrificans]|uniref:Uncharacterized protein n=1 Tax=Bowmanella denitrificans TaxID=366582 RepID=A0ABP3GIM2_9ALTE
MAAQIELSSMDCHPPLKPWVDLAMLRTTFYFYLTQRSEQKLFVLTTLKPGYGLYRKYDTG